MKTLPKVNPKNPVSQPVPKLNSSKNLLTASEKTPARKSVSTTAAAVNENCTVSAKMAKYSTPTCHASPASPEVALAKTQVEKSGGDSPTTNASPSQRGTTKDIIAPVSLGFLGIQNVIKAQS